MPIKLLAICGKSASGKDTLLKKIMEQFPLLHEIVSCTTRPPREGEVNGVNYHFLTNEEFADKLESGEMLEATVFRDWCYGTSLDSLDKDNINVGVFNVDGIDILYDNPKISLFVVLIEAPAKLRLIRSLNREENPDVEEILRRYYADEKDFEYFYGQHITWHNDTNEIPAGTPKTILDCAKQHWAEEEN